MAQDATQPNSEQAIVPVVGAFGTRGYESVRVTGNRLDNLTEATTQTRQIIAYQSRWSANAADIVLWIASVACFLRLILLLLRHQVIAPIYPLGALFLVGLPFGWVMINAVLKYPDLRLAFVLRLFYLFAGIAIALF